MSTTITDRSTQIVELATQAAADLQAMVTAASEADKRTAFEAYRDVLRLIGRCQVDDFDGRTALLTGLVAELGTVTRAIKDRNPVTDSLNSLAALTDRAFDLLKAEKNAAGSTV